MSIQYKSYAVFFLLVLLVGVQNISAQIKKDSLLPVDTAIRTGRLANGFTYFIRRNTEPRDRVVLYLVNKVGSILETDAQQGLAHFMEHMNFNGTVHYPKNALVDYLQKSGVRFGADLNAYTSFNETVYQLPIPSNDSALVINGFQIMRDWAKGALLDTDEINKERGVILEEERLGKGLSDRMSKQTLPALLGDSRYSQRIPIGKDSILKSFAPATLKQFYNTWYRPGLQALVVVGDIDVDAIETVIRNRFSDLKEPVSKEARTQYTLPLAGKSSYLAATDKEMTYTDIQFIIKHKSDVVKTEAGYRDVIVQFLYNHMLAARFAEIKRQPNIPFIDATVNFGSFFAGISAFNMEAIPVKGKTEEGFKAAYREAERAKRFGFSTGELERAKKSYLRSIENEVKEKDKMGSDFFAGDYSSYFLTGAVPVSADNRLALTKKMLPAITQQEMNALTGKYLNSANRVILVQGSDSDKAILPAEKTILQWVSEVEKEKLQPYKDNSKEGNLITRRPLAGSIVGQSRIADIGVTLWKLSNGVTVLLKPTEFSNDELSVKATAPGGLSLYGDSDFMSGSFAAGVVGASGIGDFTAQLLQQYLAGKRAAVYPVIGSQNQGMNIFTQSEDLETALQELYLYFTQPKFDTSVAAAQIERLKENIISKSYEPEALFADTVNAVLYNNYYRYAPLTLDMVGQIDFQKSFSIYKERFADASGFTFVFTGNIDTITLKPLIEAYIASLPSTRRHEAANPSFISYPRGGVQKTVYAGTEYKASVQLIFTGSYNYNENDNKAMDAMSEVLQIRLLERLREEESGVYSPGVSVIYDKKEQRFAYTIRFGCAPANADRLIASALDEVKKMQVAGPDSINLEKYKAEAKRNHELALRNNGFWSYYLYAQVQNDAPLAEINNFDAMLQSVTTDKIKALAGTYLAGQNLFRFVLLPAR